MSTFYYRARGFTLRSALAGPLAAVRATRFFRQVRRRTYYPLVFNEPINWVPGPQSPADLAALRWAMPAIAWHAGQPPGNMGGMRLVTSERIVEMPFAHRALAAARINPPARVLDFGCVHSKLALELASLGYEVVAIDLNEYPFDHPNLCFIRGNLLTLPLQSGTLDAAVAISVIEHAGLEEEAGYGEAVEGEDDLVIMRRLRELLRPGGLLVVTVPFGRGGIGPGYRVYDETSLSRLTVGWEVRHASYVRRSGGEYWLPSDPGDLAEIDSVPAAGENPFPVEGAALLALEKPEG